eukprot:6237976-Pyramimonas_sp.AAC.1
MCASSVRSWSRRTKLRAEFSNITSPGDVRDRPSDEIQGCQSEAGPARRPRDVHRDNVRETHNVALFDFSIRKGESYTSYV